MTKQRVMGTDLIIQKLEKLETELSELKLTRKESLSFNEACLYLDLSASCLYKLTSKGQIPCYCPNGKKLYFKRTELDDWVFKIRKSEDDKDEIDKMVANYLIKNPKNRD